MANDTKVSSALDVLDMIGSVDTGKIRYEVETLRKIKAWALDHLGVDYKVGDRVKIVQPIPTDNGWHHYREALTVGATGAVEEISFNGIYGYWQAMFVPDREWSVSEDLSGGRVRRYWNGPAIETPDGFEPPSKFEQEHHPAGRKHRFAFLVEWLALSSSSVSPEETE